MRCPTCPPGPKPASDRCLPKPACLPSQTCLVGSLPPIISFVPPSHAWLWLENSGVLHCPTWIISTTLEAVLRRQAHCHQRPKNSWRTVGRSCVGSLTTPIRPWGYQALGRCQAYQRC
ncbi:unnamed protein product [Ectocarpus sp. 12 AP-2014]